MAEEADGVWGPFLRNIALVVLAGVAIYVGFLVVPLVLSAPAHALTPLDYLLLQGGAVVFLGYLFARAIGGAIRRVLQKRGDLRHVGGVRIVVNMFVSAAVVAALLNLFGVSLQSIFFGSAFAGIVLGLASQTVLANMFSGIVIVVVSPFRVGERISVISANYGAFAPSYAHEMLYPTYTGTVREIGLFYTEFALDSGRVAKIPNSILVSSLIVNLDTGEPRAQRVRVTLPLSVPVTVVETAAREYAAGVAPVVGRPAPRVEVADVGPTSWDAVVSLWTREPGEEKLRDAVLRFVLPKVASPPTGAPAPPGGTKT